MATWNAWHGCHKISPGCANCYMFYYDDGYGKGQLDSERIYRTRQFNLPLKKDRQGNYKIKSGEKVLVNMTSDTFLEEADPWRDEMWAIIRKRSDVRFEFITKRIERVPFCLPADWGDGYPNVMLKATCKNQQVTGQRVPILLDLPARHRGIICCPMLGPVDVRSYLATGKIEHLSAAGEHFGGHRPLDFDWVQDLVRQAETYRVNFEFGEIGNHFIKDGKHYCIEDVEVQRAQSRKAHMNRTYYQMDFGEAGRASW